MVNSTTNLAYFINLNSNRNNIFLTLSNLQAQEHFFFFFLKGPIRKFFSTRKQKQQ